MLRHRRLLAFALTALAVTVGLSAVRPTPPATVAVPVAAHDLAAGTVLATGDVVFAALPPGVVPAGVADAPLGRTLASPVRRGEPVTDVRLLGARLAAAQPGLVTVPVRFADADIAALLQVGDRIRLLATDPTSGRSTTVAGGVLVVALPARDGAANRVTNALPGRLVVIAIADRLVPTVTSASARGFLSFAYDG